MSQQTLTVFISSRMREEFVTERRALHDLLPTIQYKGFQIKHWIFEYSAYARSAPAREVYLAELEKADLYIGLFGIGYGRWTIDEYEVASRLGIDRHIYIKDVNVEARDPQLQAFLDRETNVQTGLTSYWFHTDEELCNAVRRSIEHWIDDNVLWRPGEPTARKIEKIAAIPDHPKALIGRDQLLSEIENLLKTEDKPVLLQGFGGTGKTALAASIAARFLEAGQSPVLWLRIGNDDPSAAFKALGAPFGKGDDLAGASGVERRALLAEVFKTEAVKLLVLDDVWNGRTLKQVIDSLGDLDSPVPILITSRQRYPLLRRVDVGRMERTAAINLLRHFAGAAEDQTWTNGEYADKLCELLGDLAFALRIAGAQLAMDEIQPRVLYERIKAEPYALELPGDFMEEGRESVAALLEISLKGLGQERQEGRDARRAFEAFGALFAPTAPLELLARYLNLADEPQKAEAALNTLQRRGLLEQVKRDEDAQAAPETLYRIHDLAYSYLDATQQKHPDKRLRGVEVCRDYAKTYQENADKLDLAINNILGAAQVAENELKRDDLLIAVMRLLTEGEEFYFALRGHTARSLVQLQAAGAAAKALNDQTTAYNFFNELGFAYNASMQDFDAAFNAYQQALELSEALGDTHRQARTLSSLGLVRFRQGAEDADAYFERAEQLARNNSDDAALSYVLQHRSWKAMYQTPPDWENGRRFAEESAKLAKQLARWDIYFYAMQSLGGCEKELGLLEDALRTHQEILNIAEEPPANHVQMAEALWSIGEDYDALQRGEDAETAFNRSLQLWRQMGNTSAAAELEALMRSKNYKISA